jgi:hypothetical protein
MFKTAKRRRIDFDFQSVFLIYKDTVLSFFGRLPVKHKTCQKAIKYQITATTLNSHSI